MSDIHRRVSRRRSAFTLIELLVVIAIISMLISILMPSLSRARAQAKSTRCLATLHETGSALMTYINLSDSRLPPALWNPNPEDFDPDLPPPTEEVEYGWTEILFRHIYQEEVRLPESYPVLRNIDERRWQSYFVCREVGDIGISSGHYRVYLPAWSAGPHRLDAQGRYQTDTLADPRRPATWENIRPKLPLLGDSNIYSERGDGFGPDECSYIDAGEANIAGATGLNGNRFSDRHYGGTNYLFQDLHAARDTRLRDELAVDFDLNGVDDVQVVPP